MQFSFMSNQLNLLHTSIIFLYYSAGTCLNVYCFHLFEQNKAFRSLNELDLSFWRNILFLETITISSTFSTQHHRSE